MRKEIIEMLQNVIKTADSYNLPQTKVYVYNGGKSIAATDSKRLIKITPDSDTLLDDGFYDIAKIGKELSLVKVELDARFLDVERVIPTNCSETYAVKTQLLDKRNRTVIREYKHVMAEIIAIFAAMQKTTDYDKISFINPGFLDGILKPIGKLTDKVSLGFSSATYPVLLTADTGGARVEYVIMPISKV